MISKVLRKRSSCKPKHLQTQPSDLSLMKRPTASLHENLAGVANFSTLSTALGWLSCDVTTSGLLKMEHFISRLEKEKRKKGFHIGIHPGGLFRTLESRMWLRKMFVLSTYPMINLHSPIYMIAVTASSWRTSRSTLHLLNQVRQP